MQAHLEGTTLLFNELLHYFWLGTGYYNALAVPQFYQI